MRRAERTVRDERMAVMYREGMTLVQIGIIMGLHHGTVWRALNRLGVPMRPKGPPKGVYPSWLREANERDMAYRRWERDFILN